MTHALTSRWIERFKTTAIADFARGDFYEIRRDFVAAARAQGFAATIEDAARLIEMMMAPEVWGRIADRHADTLTILRRVADGAPTTFLDSALRDLIDGRPGDAVRGYGAVHRRRIDNFGKYRSVLTQGHDRGLAVWQVMNPFYLLWDHLPVSRGRASDRWRETQFDNQADPDPSGDDHSVNDRVLLDFLRTEAGTVDWSSARVLECGSGDGHVAKLLVKGFGVSVEGYGAFDLHESRVQATRRAVGLDDEEAGRSGMSRIFQLDILGAGAAGSLAALGPVDVLVSSSFTNVFEDDQLAMVLDRLLALKPARIVDISVITSWGLCVGRFDPSPFYAARGYRLRASRLETPSLAANESHRLWMPEKYWANRNILLYEPR